MESMRKKMMKTRGATRTSQRTDAAENVVPIGYHHRRRRHRHAESSSKTKTTTTRKRRTTTMTSTRPLYVASPNSMRCRECGLYHRLDRGIGATSGTVEPIDARSAPTKRPTIVGVNYPKPNLQSLSLRPFSTKPSPKILFISLQSSRIVYK